MTRKQKHGKYTTIRTVIWGRLKRMNLSRLARLILAELLHGDPRTNVKSGVFWPYHSVVVAKIMKEPEDEVAAALQELEQAGTIRMDEEAMLLWLREIWLHEWVSNPSYATAIAQELEPMPPDSTIWPDVLGVFKALQEQVADDETLKDRAAWYEPILEVIKTKIGSKVNIEATKEGHMYITHVQDTCVGDMCRPHVSDTTFSLQPSSLQPNNKGRIQKPRMRLPVGEAFEHFFEAYKDTTRKEHPGISKPEKERILGVFNEILETFDEVIDPKPDVAIQKTISQFFEDWKTKNLKADDPTIWLFTKPEVWRLRAYRAGVLDTESVFDRVNGSVLGEE